MTITEIIAQIKQSCEGCPARTAIAELEKLAPVFGEPKPVLAPATKPTAVKKPKPRPPAGKRAMTNETRTKIVDYLTVHPGAKCIDIAASMGLQSTAVMYHLHLLGKAVKNVGFTKNSVWYLADHNPGAAAVPEPVETIDKDESGGKLYCKMCNAPCSSSERLRKHMEVVHGRKAA